MPLVSSPVMVPVAATVMFALSESLTYAPRREAFFARRGRENNGLGERAAMPL